MIKKTVIKEKRKPGRPKNCGKCRKPKTQCKCGRPTVITPETLNNLKKAFLQDCTDAEACLYAQISESAFYEYERENPKFKQQKKQWKNNPFLVARNSIMKGMIKDPKLALDYMKHKKKEEFSTRSEMTGKDGKPLMVTQYENMSEAELTKELDNISCLKKSFARKKKSSKKKS